MRTKNKIFRIIREIPTGINRITTELIYNISIRWKTIPSKIRVVVDFVLTSFLIAWIAYFVFDLMREYMYDFAKHQTKYPWSVTTFVFGDEISFSDLETVADIFVYFVMGLVTRFLFSCLVAVIQIYNKPEPSEEVMKLERKYDLIRSKLKDLRGQLKEAQKRYENIFMFNGMATVIIDKDSRRIAEVNKKFTRVIGYEKEEAIDKYFWEFVNIKDRASVKGIIGEYERGESRHLVIDMKIDTKKGRTIDVFCSFAPINGSSICVGFFFMTSRPMFGEIMVTLGVPEERVKLALDIQKHFEKMDRPFMPVYYDDGAVNMALHTTDGEQIKYEEYYDGDSFLIPSEFVETDKLIFPEEDDD